MRKTKSVLAEKVASLPDAPGVYLLKDADGRILYVGKATSLRSRVRSYLAGPDEQRPHLAPYLARWRDVQVVTTTTVAEALVLENSFIKKERPPANVRLRDDKRYLCLRVDLSHAYPRITLVRRFRRDGALYFGPYADAGALRRTLRALRELYPLRTCTDRTLASIPAPCLYHQLGRCAAPCHGHIDEAGYGALVGDALRFLRGRRREVMDNLQQRMGQEAAALRFETAARLRDQISALERTLERQQVELPNDRDVDVVALGRDGDSIVAQVLFVRDGAVVSARDVPLPGARGDDAEVIRSFIGQFYDSTKYVPPEVLVPCKPGDRDLLEEVLGAQRGSRVRIRVPRRGARRELLEMARRNGDQAASGHRRDRAAALEAVARLGELLRLPRPPEVMECFDVSHLQGREVVASMVRFVEGRPDRDGYRRFRIRDLPRNDDFASMAEALRRRYKPADPAVSRAVRPDLVLVDGGKGQLGAAAAALREVGWIDAPLAALAKARAGRTGAQQCERVFLPGESLAVVPEPEASETRLLMRIRDEAHRFAVTYHRKLRSKAAMDSALDRIEGVGEKWRRDLLARFGSVAGIREASLEELTALPGIGRKRALRIREHLRRG